MNNLKLVVENGKLVADSREVAEMIGKRHDHLVRDIDGYVEVISENSKLSSQSNTPNLGASDFFIPSTYKETCCSDDVQRLAKEHMESYERY